MKKLGLSKLSGRRIINGRKQHVWGKGRMTSDEVSIQFQKMKADFKPTNSDTIDKTVLKFPKL